ncbi:MAG: T9SS type A sorting domain-containing protein [Chitinophagaceae bacterium]|nr:MAG: T9SS type A sorting domain-containing protein [Chitinophagaceae bacterium]
MRTLTICLLFCLGAFASRAQVIQTMPIAPTVLCRGSWLDVTFTATGTYNGPNFFLVQLSNANGSFASPTIIGVSPMTTAALLNVQVPQNTAPGTGYRIRVVSTSPAVTGTDNGADLTIGATPTNVLVNGPSMACPNSTVTLTASGASSFTWGNRTLLPGDRSEAVMAVGLRKLKSGYAGPLLRLRRESDDAESDFGSEGSDLDLASIDTWLGTAHGLVTTLYDQTGNGNHVTQPNPSQQPLFVRISANGKPGIQFSLNTNLGNEVNFSTPMTITYAARIDGTAARVLSSANNNWLLGWWNGNSRAAYYEGWITSGVPVNDNNVHVFSGTMQPGEGKLYERGRLVATSYPSEAPAGIHLNGSGLYGENSECSIYEVVAYNAVLTDDVRTRVESNLWQYFVNSAEYFLSVGASGSTETVTPTGTNAGCPSASGSLTVTSGIAGNPNTFGSYKWNVYAFQSGDGTLAGSDWQTNYSGYYTVNTLNMNTQDQWCNDCTPSDAPNYQGCPVAPDSHSWTAKRQGFPCAFYRIDIPAHDDAAQLFINGVKVWEHNGCCDNHPGVWYGFLSPYDKIEFRVTEGGGGSNGHITFTPLFSMNIQYAEPVFCRSGRSATVTTQAAQGGRFSAVPAGLSINPTTGTINPSLSQPGQYTVTYTVDDPCGAASYTASTPVTIMQSPGDPSAFGSNTWNVYAFQGGDGTTASSNWQNGYSGYYTVNTLGFDTRNQWCNECSPSSAAGYQGCLVSPDFHSWSARRQGFPCGYYQIDIPTHDNGAQLWVNGMLVWYHEGYEDAHRAVWTGYLGTDDKIEFRASDSYGGSHGVISFQLVSPNTITYPVGCTNGGPIQPTRTGSGGGTYSSTPAGLSINAQTGVVTPASSTPGAYTVSYTPAGTGCAVVPATATVLIGNPIAMVSPQPQVTCAGNATTIPAFSAAAGTAFTWTNNNPSIGLAASGTGSIVPFTATNSGDSVRTAVVSVTPYLPNQVTGALTGASASNNIRLFRNSTVSSCANPKVYPGSFTAVCRYNVHTFLNGTAAPVCITVTLRHTGTTGNVFMTAYVGSFNPSDLEENYLGDGGSSIFSGVEQTMSVQVPAGSTFIIVANTADPSFCDGYRISISGLSAFCPTPPQTFTISVHPQPTGTISYSSTPFCSNASPAPVSRTGTVGGIFTAPAGLSIDSLTGTIHPAASQPGSYTVTYTVAAAGGCSAYSTSTVVEILSSAMPMDAPANSVVCNGTIVPALPFTGGEPGSQYTWTNSNPAIGLPASGTGDLPVFVAANNTSDPIIATLSVGNAAAACANATQRFTITVLPTPIVNPEGNLVLCANSPSGAIGFSGNASTYNWTNTNPAIGLAASGAGPINFITMNNGATTIESMVSVMPVLTMGTATCSGKGMSFRVSVRPPVIMDAIASQTLCSGTVTTAINFAGAPAGTVYSWTNDNPSIGMGASGTGPIPAFTAQNNTPVEQAATITVAPLFSHCTGSAQTFTITVLGSASAISYPGSPYCPIGEARVTRSGSSVGTFSASPAGLVLNAATGAINLAQSLAGTYTVTFTVSGAPCNGQSTTQVRILPKAAVNAVPNLVYCNGATTSAISFAGTASNFSWTNTNPSIGLPASGTGNLPSFVAINGGTTTETALITVTPLGTGGSNCSGRSVTFRIQVFPTPSADPIGAQVYCRGEVTTPVTFSGSVAGATYNWTASNLLTGIAPGRGVNSIPSFTTTSNNRLHVSTLITVTPSANKCVGSPMQFSYEVNTCVAQPGNAGNGGETARHADLLQLAPNPARDRVTIRLSGADSGPRTVEVLDQYGRTLIRPASFNGNTCTVNLSGLVPGAYVVRIVDLQTKVTAQRKLIRL